MKTDLSKITTIEIEDPEGKIIHRINKIQSMSVTKYKLTVFDDEGVVLKIKEG